MENQEVPSVAEHEVREASPVHINVRARWPVLHRVPPQVRENKKNIYDPVVLSLGPYHNGQSQFQLAEELKDEVLNIVCGAKDKGFLRSKILERIDEIRHFYGGLSKDKYDDEALAEMMLRDACVVIYKMEESTDKNDEKYLHFLRLLGGSGAAFMYRDFFMLENQIPLWLIKLLISLTFDDNKGEALLGKYLNRSIFLDLSLTQVPWKDEEEEPLHLLEAIRRTSLFVEEDKSNTIEPIKGHCDWVFKPRWGSRKSSKTSKIDVQGYPSRSVTDLKAKGVHFEPSSYCLKDIKFTSYSVYGKLQLPILHVTNNSKVLYSNAIAFEMSPGTAREFAVTSYIDFMKALIESPKDVKELREKGILTSRLANNEEIVKMFKEIDTYTFYDYYMFVDVKKRIHEHCNNKAKTWMAELAYTYFRTPWTAIALFAATFLLCLTFLQTYYSMNPRNSGSKY